MITFPRFSVAITFGLLAGVSLLEYYSNVGYHRELAAQAKAAAKLDHQIKASQTEADQLLELLHVVRDAPPESTEPSNVSSAIDAAEAERWLKKVKQLRQILTDQPAQRIPQLQLLNDREWVALARDADLDTADGGSRALSAARSRAKSRFASLLFSALKSYLQASHGELPSDLPELLPYFREPEDQPGFDRAAVAVDPAMLAQYELTASGKFSDAPEGVVVKEKAVVDERLDDRIELISREGSLTFRHSYPHPDTIDLDLPFERAVRAFAAANQGAPPSEPRELLPFLKDRDGRILAEVIAENQTPMTPETRKAFRDHLAELLRTPPTP